MELYQLRYFVSIAKSPTMAIAADVLNVSQSALSLSVKALESELGVALFEKQGRRKELTESGRVFLEHLEPLLNSLDELKEMVSSSGRLTVPTLTIAIESVDFATELILSYRSLHPDAEIIQIRPSRKNARSLLMLGKADLCIGLFDDTSYELESELVFSGKFVALTHANHPFASRSSLTMKDIAEETLICLGNDFALRQLIEQYFRQTGIRPYHVFEVGDAETLPIPIKNGHGVTFVSDFHYQTLIHNLQHSEKDIWPPYESMDAVAIPISDVNCIHNVYLTTYRKSTRSPLLQDFISFARSYSQEALELGYYPTLKYRKPLVNPFNNKAKI